MTTLELSTSQPIDPAVSLLSRVKWSVLVPWLVAVLTVGTNGYHRFMAGEEARVADSREIQQLRSEVATLNQKVAVLIAVVERVESQQNAAILYQGKIRR